MENPKKQKKKRETKSYTVEEAIQDPDNKLTLDQMNIEESESEYEEYTEESVYESYSDEEEEMEEVGDVEESNKKQVNILNDKDLDEDNIDFDNAAYEMLHRANPEWPCMSIDFLLPERYFPPIDNFFSKTKQYKEEYPFKVTMVAGAYTSNPKNGVLYVTDWCNMKKTKYDNDPDKEDESEEDLEPKMKVAKEKIRGNVLRIKSMRNSYIAAYWADNPSIEIVDLRPMLLDLEEVEEETVLSKGGKKKAKAANQIKINSFNKKLEGFAINWSEMKEGYLCVGGQEKELEIYAPNSNYTSWSLLAHISNAHKDSVEDVVFSPHDPNLLASASCDRSIKIWDMRMKTAEKQVTTFIMNGHESDINCLSWSTFSPTLIASGSDDCSFKTWDTRFVQNGCVSRVLWHQEPITAIGWDPYDAAQMAVSSEDNKLSIWDFSVEADEQQLVDQNEQSIPQQLVFLHQGQKNIKDLKWHPSYKNLLVSTAENGINVFKPAFDDTDSIYEDEIY